MESHFELMPNLELIRRPQNNRPNLRPFSDDINAWIIQQTSLVLSHYARSAGHGSLVKFVLSMIVNAASQLIITDMNSRTFMLTHFPSLLSDFFFV